jgi:hypothetical protein
MTKNKKVLTFSVIIVLSVLVGVYAYKTYKRKTGVYVETVKVDQGWGYKIYVKGRLVVDQNTMPALSGNKPFPCEKAAEKTANLVVQKVGKGGMPTLSIQEVEKILRENCE